MSGRCTDELAESLNLLAESIFELRRLSMVFFSSPGRILLVCVCVNGMFIL